MRVRTLVLTLDEWADCGRRLAVLLRRQSEALRRRDIHEVESMRSQLESLGERMSNLEVKRKEAATALAQQLKTNPTLEGLSSVLDRAESASLERAAGQVREVGEVLDPALRENRALLENDLAYVHGMLGLIAQVASEQTPYGHAPAPAVWIDREA